MLGRDHPAREEEHAGAVRDRCTVALERGRELARPGTAKATRSWAERSPAAPRSTCTPARASIAARAAPSAPAPMTAARRSGGRPPSHSHWSITLGQMRSVTAAASCGEAFSTLGKVSGPPIRMRTLCGRKRQPLRTSSVPITATGTTGAPVSSARRPTPRLGLPSAPGRMRVPSANISTASPRSRIAFAVASMSWSPVPRTTGNAPSELRIQPTNRYLKSSSLAT